MAGHSKWANIKRHKAVQDAKKGATFAKYTREIIMATRLGGAEPSGNFRLRAAIDKAKAAGVSKDTIEQAIQKGQGKGQTDTLESLTYEGYGPGGVAILIDANTDNRNRTAGDIRSYFNKYHGNLGETGCCSWLFEEKALVLVDKNHSSEEHLTELGIEAELEDIECTENNYILTVKPDALNALCGILAHNNIPVASTETTKLPQNEVTLQDEAQIKPLLKLLDAIENHDDVNSVYANVIIVETHNALF